ncbi:MAG: autotransporter domain-containing protein, partial [Roseibium sp.]|uniref:autotransporter outer membrane beta-barrel domain-containing protein n=1 Tax=Roseibium sp. TaxID=1936156 RepID=UPI002625F45E
LSDVQSDLYFSFTVGGQNGASGNGGIVTVDNTDTTITTYGAQSSGIFAQSVGGGGGAVIGGIEDANGDAVMGGSGDSSGDGSNVNVTHSGSITTAYTADSGYNIASFGVFAQSVGGGGGYAGSVQFGGTANIGSDLTDMSSDSDTSGDGGDVTVQYVGDIHTYGGASVGIFAQSVGGGGGVAGQADASGTLSPEVYIGNGGGEGIGGVVHVRFSDGSIYTDGAGAHGIFAQSAGGPTVSDVATTKVKIEVDGNVSATGAGSHGIFAQSIGEGMGKISIEIESGATITGGDTAVFTDAEDGAGVFFKDGTSGTLTNAGTITSVLGYEGVAINVKDTSVTVVNDGVITGQWLKASSIFATNNEGATINMGALMDVDSLTNSGTLAIGSTNTVSQTVITGDLVQTDTGQMLFSFNPGASDTDERADHLTIDGDADIAGEIVVSLEDDWTPYTGEQTVDLISVSGSSSLVDTAVVESTVGQYSVDVIGNEVYFTSDIDFANSNATSNTGSNQSSTASHLQKHYSSGSGSSTYLGNLIHISDQDVYASALLTLDGKVLTDSQVTSLNSSLRFKDQLLSCPQYSGADKFLDLGTCTWARAGGDAYYYDGHDGNIGFDSKGYQLAAGAQYELENGLVIGGGFSYDQRWIDVPDADAKSNGYQLQLGATVKKSIADLELAGAFAAGVGKYDITRNPYMAGTSSGDQTIWNFSGQVRVAYLLGGPDWFVKPQIGLGYDYIIQEDYRESGASHFNLFSDQQEEFYLSVQPAVVVGAELKTDMGALIRPKLKLGLTHFLTDANPTTNSGFVSSSHLDSSFKSTTDLDKTRLDIAAEIDLLMEDKGWNLRAEVGAGFSENAQGYNGGLKLSIPF